MYTNEFTTNRVTDVRRKIKTPLETTKGISISLEVFKNAIHKLILYAGWFIFVWRDSDILSGGSYLSRRSIIPLDKFKYSYSGFLISLQGFKYPSWGFTVPLVYLNISIGILFLQEEFYNPFSGILNPRKDIWIPPVYPQKGYLNPSRGILNPRKDIWIPPGEY